MRRHVARRRALGLSLILSAACFLLTGCEIEENIVLNADGSGSYVARVAVEKEVGEAIGEVRSEAEKRGFRVVEEGETADRRFLVVRREFHDISELNDEKDSYGLSTERKGLLRRVFHLTLAFRSTPAENGFTRTVKITMPTTISSASAGTVDGTSVEWDCSRPGTLQVEAAGLVLEPRLQRAAILGGLAVGLLVLAGILATRWRRQARCRRCGAALRAGARFCESCGTPRERATNERAP